MTIEEAISTFKNKYQFNSVLAIGVNSEYPENICVYTTDAKIWVDLPVHHEGYQVKMILTKNKATLGM